MNKTIHIVYKGIPYDIPEMWILGYQTTLLYKYDNLDPVTALMLSVEHWNDQEILSQQT